MPSLHVNAQRFQTASRKLALLSRTKTPREVLTSHMRQFVANVIAITPPSQGSLSQGKARGEAAVLGDLLKLCQPVTVDGSASARREAQSTLLTVDDLLNLHRSCRDKANGRVQPRGEMPFVSQRDFQTVLRGLLQLVGILAAGWNAPAEKLGVSVPSWIKRHGTRYGVYELRADSSSIRISLGNNVPFADNVSTFQRRVNYALRATAIQLEKGYAQAIERAARSSGFR